MSAETPPGWSLKHFVEELPQSRRLRSHEPILFRVNGRNVYASRSYDEKGATVGTWHPGKPERDGYSITVTMLSLRGGAELPVLTVLSINRGCFRTGTAVPSHVLRMDLYTTANALLSMPVLVSASSHIKQGTTLALIDILELMHRHG